MITIKTKGIGRAIIQPYKYSLSFNGSNTYVSLGIGNLITGDISIAGWLKVSSSGLGTNRTIIAKRTSYSSSTMMYQLSLNGSNNFFFGRSGGTNINFTTYGNNYPKDQWFHFVVTKTNSNSKLYINSKLVDTQGTFTFGTGTTADIKIGAVDSGSSEVFNGKMNDISLYSREITAEEIINMYSYNTIPSNCVYRYVLSEGSGTTAIDSSGTGNNGTIVNATYSTDVAFGSRNAASNRQLASNRQAV